MGRHERKQERRAALQRIEDQKDMDAARTLRRRPEDEVAVRGLGQRRLQVGVWPPWSPGELFELRLLGDSCQAYRSAQAEQPGDEELWVLGYEPLLVDAAELLGRLRRAAALSVPLAFAGPDVEQFGVLDGTRVSLRVEVSQALLRLNWPLGHPGPLAHIEHFVVELLELLRAAPVDPAGLQLPALR